MVLKALLTIIVVVALLSFIFGTPRGREYAQGLTAKFAEFIKSFPPFFQVPSGHFGLIARLNNESITNQTFVIRNSTFFAQGICLDKIRFNGIFRDANNVVCEFDLNVEEGSIIIGKNGNLQAKVSARQGKIDNVLYTADNLMQIEFHLIPISYLFLSEKKDMKIIASGEMKKLVNGELDQIKNLKNEEVEIFGYVGLVKLSGGEIELQGASTYVRGKTFLFAG